MRKCLKYFIAYQFLFVFGILAASNAKAQGWRWAIGSISNEEGVSAGPMAVDTFGNLIVAMCSHNSANYAVWGGDTVFNPGRHFYQTFLTKTDSAGNTAVIAYSDSSDVAPIGLATNQSGCIYLLGSYLYASCKIGSATLLNPGGFGYMTYFLAKLNPSGSVLWAKNIISSGDTPIVFWPPGNLSICGNGEVYVTGIYEKSTVIIGNDTLRNADVVGGSYDVFIAKYDSMGNPLWARSCGGTNSDRNFGLTATKDGDFYIAGNYNSQKLVLGSDTLFNPRCDSVWYSYIAKFDAWGNSLWTKNIEGSKYNIYRENNLGKLVVDENENVYLTGSFVQDSINFDAYLLTHPGFFLVKIDSSGNTKWAKQGGEISPGPGYGLTTDHCGNVWVSGDIPFPAALLPSSIEGDTLLAPTPYFAPMFIAHYDTAGNYINSMTFSSGGSGSNGVLVDNKGDFYLKAAFQTYPVALGSHMLLPDTSWIYPLWETFVAKYAYDSFQCMPYHFPENIESLNEISSPFSVFPNPAQSELIVRYSGPIGKLIITNLLGQTVFRELYRSEEVRIDVGYLPSGMYFVRIDHGDAGRFIKR